MDEPAGRPTPAHEPSDDARGTTLPDRADLLAALRAWAAEHGLVLAAAELREPASSVTLAPDPAVLHALTVDAVARGDVPADWDDDTAALTEGTPAWTWSEATARAYDRHRIVGRRDAHLRALTGLLAAHGHHGAVELRITGPTPRHILEHLAEVRTGRPRPTGG
ncbi:hypothetical protein GCM10011374_02360 [Kocuria dechangensis]|uniref:Uncharacterized protein n=1 Tax=Kocuria dechangensis TaxID=1176249 RepID=A0A917GFW3_9MICC|nr:hypothetical protein [Kocuria dechangensis]GGG43542.1 hypothetical protein GCM10011374_02360 [Kocuria dechangensis]